MHHKTPDGDRDLLCFPAGGTTPQPEIERLRARVAELEAWQLAIAEGTGFVNFAEGQSGYEVADPQTILNHFKC